MKRIREITYYKAKMEPERTLRYFYRNILLGVVHSLCRAILTPLPPTSRFLLVRPQYYRHKILNPLHPKTVTSFLDNPLPILYVKIASVIKALY